MKYYEFALGTEISNPKLCKRFECNIDEYSYIDCKYISPDGWNKNNLVFYMSEGITEDFIWTRGWPIVSTKLKAVFETYNISGVQFLPVTVLHINNPSLEVGSYYYMNILKTISPLNTELSTFMDRDEDGTPCSVVKAVFNESAVKGDDIFRIFKEKQGIYASAKLVKLIRNEKCTGIDFFAIRVHKD